jgi:hypothetical protein
MVAIAEDPHDVELVAAELHRKSATLVGMMLMTVPAGHALPAGHGPAHVDTVAPGALP